MRPRSFVSMLLLALAAGEAGAAVPAARGPLAVTREHQRDVSLTVYNGQLGLVKDVREAAVSQGISDVHFADVASAIDPTTVHLRSLSQPGGLRVLEQNYEYDLVSSARLMEKYVGRTVRLEGADGLSREATLLSAQGPVYEIEGRIHLGAAGRLVLPRLPENLVTRPTLVWRLRSDAGGPQRIEASYLTGAITWRADYVLVLNAADDRAGLTGWVTIDNRSGATYADAALKLVAGDVNRATDPRRALRAADMAAKPAAAATHEFAAEGLFEYHLYTLDGRTTLKDNQTKQLTLLAAADVPVRKELVYWGAAEYYRTQYGVPLSNQKVQVRLELVNAREHRLGVALPRGKVRVYKADRSGSQQFVGEDWIDHTPRDERVKVTLGHAFDVVGQRTQKDWRRLGPGLAEVEWEVALRNHKSEDQVVTVIEPVPGDWQVLSSTHPWEKIESHTLRYRITVPRNGAAKLVYRVRIRG